MQQPSRTADGYPPNSKSKAGYPAAMQPNSHTATRIPRPGNPKSHSSQPGTRQQAASTGTAPRASRGGDNNQPVSQPSAPPQISTGQSAVSADGRATSADALSLNAPSRSLPRHLAPSTATLTWLATTVTIRGKPLSHCPVAICQSRSLPPTRPSRPTHLARPVHCASPVQCSSTGGSPASCTQRTSPTQCADYCDQCRGCARGNACRHSAPH